jgi:signal transduction histidine kinase
MLRLLTVLFLLSGVPFPVSGQQAKIDSLAGLLDNSLPARERAEVLLELSSAWYDYDLAKGFDYANQALDVSRKAKYGEGIRSALSLKGFYYFDIGEFKKALEFYTEASAVSIPADDRLGYTYVLTGNVYSAMASWDSADIYYNKAISLLKSLNARRSLAYGYRNAGRMYVRQWKNEQAEEFFNEALKIYRTSENKFGMADVYFGLAELNINRAKYITAQEYVDKGCTIAEELNDDFLRLHCNIFRGEIQFRLGEFLPSLETLLQAVELLKKRDSPQTLARVYGDLGDAYEALSQNDVALKYFFEANKIAERLGLRWEMARYQSSIAWIYKNQRNYEAAFDFIERSHQIRTTINDIAGISNCYNVKSIIYFQQKRYSEAIEWLDKSLKIREKIGHLEGVGACLYNLGLVFEEQKQFEKALTYQFRALDIEKAIGNKYNLGIGYNSIGSLYTYLHQYDSAVVYLNKAEEIGQQTGSLELQMENSYYWSEYFEYRGNDKEALRWHKRYADLNDSVYYENSATKLAEMQALYQTDQKDKEIQLLNQEKLLQSNQIQLQDARINLQSFVIVFVIVAFILVSLLAYKSYQYNREIKTAHTEIVNQKEEIQNQAEELQKAYHLIAESHKELEAKVEERTSALRAAYKELDTFFYRASHDFRRPLTTFLGLVEVAHITVKDQTAIELFEKVEETATNLDKMLFKLQSISDLGSQQLEYEEVSIPQIFNDILEVYKAAIEEKNIRTYTSCVLPEQFYSYPALIQMILENLVENAISFCRYEKAFIKLRAFQGGGKITIEVEDNGDGIDPKYHEQIFEMYFRGNERSKGNGLGLYIVRKAVDKLGGNLEFISARDKGTLFRLQFSLKSEPLHFNVDIGSSVE